MKAAVPVRLGNIDLPDASVVRSDFRWLFEDAQDVRAGDLVAYCNFALSSTTAAFAEESFDLQVAFAAPLTGRFRHRPGATRGGYIARLAATPWRAEDVLGYIEPTGDMPPGTDPDPRLMFLAGRRPNAIIEDRSGLLTGWHNRRRAWWGTTPYITLLGAGTCEQDAILRGEGPPFHALFCSSMTGHVVLSQAEPLVPSTRILIERMERTAEDIVSIRDDAIAGLASGPTSPTAEDWLFIGALLNGLERSPLDESYDLIDRTGLHRAGPAQALCLSLGAELPVMFRHKRLGYTIACHGYRLMACGMSVKQWLRSHFDSIDRSIDAVRSDYATLASRARLFVVNQLSTQAHERIRNFSMLDAETYGLLGTLRAKQWNLMLHELADADILDVVDADAIAARFGMTHHLPDGTHPSRQINTAVRKELLTTIRARGLSGF